MKKLGFNMAQILKKLARKTGVVLRGGWRPVSDRWHLQYRNKDWFNQEAASKEGYHSQWGQDKWMAENIFKRRRGGFFVDIGAYNGIDISNTYYFEKQLGWSGICVEPMPRPFAELSKNRNCICAQGCVADRDGEAEFLEVEGDEMLSGLASTLNQSHAGRIEGRRINRIKVPRFSLNTLLNRYKVNSVDFVSIDTEGSEMEILRHFDWDGPKIGVLCIENTYHGDLLAEFLYGKGYRLNCILHGDEIYVRA
jgi:FkbM family methyltransferase